MEIFSLLIQPLKVLTGKSNEGIAGEDVAVKSTEMTQLSSIQVSTSK
jgi:hypothetical protein